MNSATDSGNNLQPHLVRLPTIFHRRYLSRPQQAAGGAIELKER